MDMDGVIHGHISYSKTGPRPDEGGTSVVEKGLVHPTQSYPGFFAELGSEVAGDCFGPTNPLTKSVGSGIYQVRQAYRGQRLLRLWTLEEDKEAGCIPFRVAPSPLAPPAHSVRSEARPPSAFDLNRA